MTKNNGEKKNSCSAGCVVIILVLSIPVVLFIFKRDHQSKKQPITNNQEEKSKPITYVVDADRSEEAQEKRNSLMRESGFITRWKISKGTPHIFVTEEFRNANRQDQIIFLEMLYAFFMTEDENFGQSHGGLYADFIQIDIDVGGDVGKNIGNYDPMKGIHLD